MNDVFMLVMAMFIVLRAGTAFTFIIISSVVSDHHVCISFFFLSEHRRADLAEKIMLRKKGISRMQNKGPGLIALPCVP